MENIIKTYKFPILGALIGLGLAVSLFTVGFLKTIVVMLLILGGAYVGYYVQKTLFLNE